MSALMAARLRDDVLAAHLAHAMGLSPEASRALRSVTQARHAKPGAAPVLNLAFTDDCPASHMPRRITSPLDGSWVPVRAHRAPSNLHAHNWMRATNGSNPAAEGTLAAVLRFNRQPDRLFALTAGHVCGATNRVSRGDQMVYLAETGIATGFEGVLLDWQPNFVRRDSSCLLDAGIAELQPDALGDLHAQQDWWPTGVGSAPSSAELRLRTRGKQVVGQYQGVSHVELTVCGTYRYVLQSAFTWIPTEATEAGDSGAAIFNERDELVGIHAGGSPAGQGHVAYGVPIERILSWADASVVRRGEALAPLQAMVQPAMVAKAVPIKPSSVAEPGAADKEEVMILARTLYGEAAGEGAAGMEAVAHVVLNRVDANRWWGRSIQGVCLQNYQFSCWNQNTPMRQKLLGLQTTNAVFKQAIDIARRLVSLHRQGLSDSAMHAERVRADHTNGATHYYAPRLVATPRWAQGKQRCARIGGHDFFKGIA